MADEKPKEGVKTENNDHINLKVAGQDGSVVQFKIKRHTPLSKLMKAYCERQGAAAAGRGLQHIIRHRRNPPCTQEQNGLQHFPRARRSPRPSEEQPTR
uniref:Rad60/SUMO-like domain-containing protein n=1 Tax=Oncorhynchus tshawytscha TaxID=74940 RepID=A0A8C8F8Z1_ONCTS